MANPTSRWDWVPVWGVWLNVDDTPLDGRVTFQLQQRVQRVDGRIIFAAGATVTKTIGDMTGQDPMVREAVRAAWRAEDETKPGFNGSAWNAWWNNVIARGAIFTSFPATDDPDILHDPDKPWSVIVSEALTLGSGRRYPIVPLLADLDLTPPGVNLGLIEVPPGSPTPAGPMFARGLPGGVASLDREGKVPVDQLPENAGGIASWDSISGKPTVIAAGSSMAEARAAIGAAAGEGGDVPEGVYLAQSATLASTPETSDPDTMQMTIAGVVRSWWNEWRAIRGRNPYTTWADALVRAVVGNGDHTGGNAIEVVDRRTGAAASVLWGVNWGSGRMMQGDAQVGAVFVLQAGQTTGDIPATLPPGTLVVRRLT